MARTAHSAMASRWSGGRVSMGTSGRDRRVRSLIGKRGQRVEDSDEEQHGRPVVVEDTDDNLQGEPASGSAGPAGEVDANGEEVEYTRRQQVSPTRKRGRLPVPGRTKLKGRTSLAEILAASPVKIAQILIKNGFCSENPAAGTCACQSPKWKLEPRGGALFGSTRRNSTFHQTTAAFFSEWITEQSARFSRPSTRTLCPLLAS